MDNKRSDFRQIYALHEVQLSRKVKTAISYVVKKAYSAPSGTCQYIGDDDDGEAEFMLNAMYDPSTGEISVCVGKVVDQLLFAKTPERIVDFAEAFAALQEGKRVTRLIAGGDSDTYKLIGGKLHYFSGDRYQGEEDWDESEVEATLLFRSTFRIED